MNTPIEQYSGDEALYCMNGKHAYTLGICTWCQRKDPLSSNTPTVNN